MAAPEGNTFSSKDNRMWANTLRRAIVQSDGAKIRAIAEKVIAMAEAGDMAAVREIGDRLDGKPAQNVTLAGDADNPLQAKVIVEFVGTTPASV